MRTTIELPDSLFRKAKAAAAKQGKSLQEFFTDAIQDRLRDTGSSKDNPRPWEIAFGGLKHLHRENVRIEKLISDEFGKFDADEWR